ncbi:hypothetical protein MJO57_03740 [Endozoicomonas sp. SCSIO W0465]|nr:hypothetical protein [Endozoicomonas sp. SCSIO W0465]USE37351.1 hypothetical protein MJO57_03740 [Endozoicomonas sp. SCSIO W0465]
MQVFFLLRDRFLVLFPEVLGKSGKIRQFLNIIEFFNHFPEGKTGCIDLPDIIEFKAVKNHDQKFSREFGNPSLLQRLILQGLILRAWLRECDSGQSVGGRSFFRLIYRPILHHWRKACCCT